MTRCSESCYEVADAATSLIHAIGYMGSEIPCAASRDHLAQAARVIGALATWANAWGDHYATDTATTATRETRHA